MIQNTDGFIDEQVRKHILHPERHVQDVRHLKRKRKRRRYRLYLDEDCLILIQSNDDGKP